MKVRCGESFVIERYFPISISLYLKKNKTKQLMVMNSAFIQTNIFFSQCALKFTFLSSC